MEDCAVDVISFAFPFLGAFFATGVWVAGFTSANVADGASRPELEIGQAQSIASTPASIAAFASSGYSAMRKALSLK
jgi:hypothetical protein